MRSRLDCPSVQAETKGARIYGVVMAEGDDRRIGYLTQTVEPTPELMAIAGPVKPTELFRMAAPCAKTACKHFNGGCTLVQRIVAALPPVVSALPECQIRPTCRWFAEEGREACLRCPQVTTDDPARSDEMLAVAAPPPRA